MINTHLSSFWSFPSPCSLWSLRVHSFRYETILERLAEIIQKREDEKNKFKIEAERRRVNLWFNARHVCFVTPALMIVSCILHQCIGGVVLMVCNNHSTTLSFSRTLSLLSQFYSWRSEPKQQCSKPRGERACWRYSRRSWRHGLTLTHRTTRGRSSTCTSSCSRWWVCRRTAAPAGGVSGRWCATCGSQPRPHGGGTGPWSESTS